MKSKEFILTEDTESDQLKADIIASEKDQRRKLLTEYAGIQMYVEENCQPYLKEVGGFENAIFRYPLLRGIQNITFPKDAYSKIVSINQNRLPTDTPPDIQVLIDDWFQRHFGIRFRKTSLHCTGDLRIANKYSGESGPIVVIPVGDFHYAYSNVYEDLFISLHKFGTKPPNDGFGISHENLLKFYKNRINDFMERGQYRVDTDLLAAIQQGHEIMISCKEAVVIQHKFLYNLVRSK